MRRAVRLPLEALAPYLLELHRSVAGAEVPRRPGEPPPTHISQADSQEPDLAAQPCEPLAWSRVFGNDHPVEIEVGFGKGLFLITSGTSHPDVNFLGIEIERKYTLYVANRLAKRKLTNVRVACADARFVFERLIPESSVQAVHVYFPDPWWKTKHRKRRLFTSAFARACARVLEKGGQLHLATDVADYFVVMQQLVAEHACLQPLPPPDPAEPRHDLDYLTNFERKYRHEGRAISRGLYEKV